ncbi:MAG: IS5 family transposase [Magnetovibrio sp.]|nr:IS5 family transposase [Magnetovibrio sp.]
MQPHIPKPGRGPKRVDDRLILNGIFYILRTGVPWRDLPDRYGPGITVYNRYARWARRGVWKAIFDALVSRNDDSLFFIDSSIVMAHQAATGVKGGIGAGYRPLTRRSMKQGSLDTSSSPVGRSTTAR